MTIGRRDKIMDFSGIGFFLWLIGYIVSGTLVIISEPKDDLSRKEGF